MKLKSNFRVMEVKNDFVKIKDLNTGKSVTNDAEAVCEFLFRHYGDRRFLYYDTQNTLGELVHKNGTFQSFGFLSQSQ